MERYGSERATFITNDWYPNSGAVLIPANGLYAAEAEGEAVEGDLESIVAEAEAEDGG